MKKKILIGLAVVLGLMVVGVIVLIASFDLDETVQTQTEQYLPEVEKALGREVTVGQIRTTILPVLGAEVRDVVIAGATPDAEPLLRIEQIRFGVELWTAIKSGGDEIRLKELVIDGMAVEVVRNADGTLSTDEVIARLTEGPPKEEEPPKPLSPEAKRFIRNLELQRIAVENSRVRLVDRQADTTATIDDLLVELTDVRLDSAFEVRVAAAVLAAERNFDLRVALGPIPVGDPEAKLPVDHISLEADGVDLAALVPYMGGAGATLKSAALHADLRIDDPLGAAGATTAKGSLALKNLSVGHPTPGEVFDLVIEPNVAFSMASETLDLTGFSVAMAEMKLVADGRITGLLGGRPTFHGLKLRTEQFDFGRLFALLPDAKAALPPGMKLDGPLALDVTADGDPQAQTVRLNLDLKGAEVVVPDALAKPRGTKLGAALHADLTQTDLDLKALSVDVGPLALSLKGTVKNFDDPTFDLDGGIAPTPIQGIARLLPPVKAAVPPDVQIDGRIAMDLKAKGTRQTFSGKVGLRVSDADLAAPGATLKGSGRLELLAQGAASGAVTASLNSDLNALEVVAGDALRKPAGTPLALSGQAALAADGGLDLPRLKLIIGPLTALASGSRSAAGDLSGQLDVQTFAVGELARILPGLADNPYAAARIGLAGKVKGNPAQPATVEAELSKFEFAMGRSSLSGTMTVRNPEAPYIRFDFASPYMDLDALLPGGGEEAPEEGGPPPEIPEIVKVMDAAGGLRVARGRFADIDFTDFVARLTLEDGRLTFESLDFDAYDGHFTGARTTVDLKQRDPKFAMRMKLTDISADAILTQQADMPNTLTGRMSTEMDLGGKGLEWPTIRDSLSGNLGLGIANGRFEKLALGNAVLQGVVDQVPGLNLDRSVKTGLKDLAGQFEVEDGRMNLIRPMSVETGEGPMLLTGSIGLDKTLDLEGTLQLQPATVSRLSSGRIKLDKAIPVGLKLGGTLTDPKVSGVDAKTLGAALLGAAAMALGADKAVDAAKKAAAEAEAKARAAAAKAEAEARRQAAAAKAAAAKKKKELEEKARREAEKAKKAAEKKAKDEAKKRLKGLF